MFHFSDKGVKFPEVLILTLSLLSLQFFDLHSSEITALPLVIFIETCRSRVDAMERFTQASFKSVITDLSYWILSSSPFIIYKVWELLKASEGG